MKRVFAILLSLLIVGTPTAFGAELSYRDANANIAAHTEALAAVTAENETLEAQAQDLFANAQELVRIEEEELRKAEEAKKLPRPLPHAAPHWPSGSPPPPAASWIWPRGSRLILLWSAISTTPAPPCPTPSLMTAPTITSTTIWTA